MRRFTDPYFIMAITALTFITACLAKATIAHWLDNAAIGFVAVFGVGLASALTFYQRPSQTLKGNDDA